MNITLKRTLFNSEGVFGEFLLEDGTIFCVTLEHPYENQGVWTPKVPSGEYVCQRRFSPKFQYDVFEIMNVPGCTYIEIHVGNFATDSDGCILLGQALNDQSGVLMITNSKAAFAKFMSLQNGLDIFQLTVL
jgi:hypothetical protein